MPRAALEERADCEEVMQSATQRHTRQVRIGVLDEISQAQALADVCEVLPRERPTHQACADSAEATPCSKQTGHARADIVEAPPRPRSTKDIAEVIPHQSPISHLSAGGPSAGTRTRQRAGQNSQVSTCVLKNPAHESQASQIPKPINVVENRERLKEAVGSAETKESQAGCQERDKIRQARLVALGVIDAPKQEARPVEDEEGRT